MSTRVALNHRTEYHYDKPVLLGPQAIQLRPAPHCRTEINDYSLRIKPPQHTLNWQLDPYNNHLARVLFSGKTKDFSVEVDLVAKLVPFNPFGFVLDASVADFPFEYEPGLRADLAPYLATDSPGPLLKTFLSEISRDKTAIVGFLVDLNRRLRDRIQYVTRLDPGVQTCEQTLENRSGSCRDSAWLLVQVLRNMGVAARFVSGYLIQLDDEPMIEGRKRTDSAAFHAWTEAFLPGAGWLGMDPTSGLFAGEGHIPLVCTPNASRAAPIEGTVEPAGVEFDYSISVRLIDEAPQMTEALAETDWKSVREFALKVDRDLQTQNVRLTMGGEPTFVGLDEVESAQWNIDALGPLKRTRGLSLIRRLREKLAPGGMLHYGQGKWYPGEPLPRWALGCAWRVDGVPVWERIDLIAREDAETDFGVTDTHEFMDALTHRLQVGGENVLPAFDSDSNEPAGFILPIRRRQAMDELYWSSQLWFARPQRLQLSQGDSPIGYRIPTDVMSWVAPDKLKYEYEVAPFADRVKLPPVRVRRMDLFGKNPRTDSLAPLSSTAETATELIRPSLCVQARYGRLHVFLPYVAKLADYLDLVAAVEDTCEFLRKPVWLEGYAAPSDPRLRTFSLTPDPGVLEVNLPPASDWNELELINTVLFEEAAKERLTAEKFNYDGTHLATGGGNHIVIGGASVLDSPILRRPDLLQSMVSFWQNHPSMSYLFSGMYVGPTSQSPRVDEARMDALYELEVAFGNLPARDCSPNIVDGLFRNLLVDVTGNSHRAEFCIDKLYPPEGRGSRLGLLELRAFEMAPRVRMVLLEMLLVRALVCMFWKRRFENQLVRWGTALHDRFLLPHFVMRDFKDVLGDLREFGYTFQEKWFDSHFEFRFPQIGSLSVEEIKLELRHALEPWNVLAEETTSGGTVRVVDSSLERIQVKLSGVADDTRYTVTCNGRTLPMNPTEKPGESVAGVRFRARRLSDTLHPTIPVHAPLEFEIIDRKKNISDGRCIYHVVPPSGGIYTSRPAKADEAEERRRERFQVLEPGQAAVHAHKPFAHPMFPMTLDLRMPVEASS